MSSKVNEAIIAVFIVAVFLMASIAILPVASQPASMVSNVCDPLTKPAIGPSQKYYLINDTSKPSP